MTLDAGGTNFRFSAMRGTKPVTETVALPSNGDNLDKCLANIVEGFTRVKKQCPEPPVAISFVFPGPGRLSQPASSATWATCPASAAASPSGRCSRSSSASPPSSTTTATCSSMAKPSPASCPTSTACSKRPAAPNATTTSSASRSAPASAAASCATASCSSATTRWPARSGCCATSSTRK